MATESKVRARRERVAALPADGRSLKDITPELSEDLQTVHRDARLLGFVERQRDAAGRTPLQREILARVAEGRATNEIASELAMKPATVRQHITQIVRKHGRARNRTHAAVLWVLANQQREYG